MAPAFPSRKKKAMKKLLPLLLALGLVALVAGDIRAQYRPPTTEGNPYDTVIRVTRILTAAEFKALNSTPITIVAADANTYYVPKYTSWHKAPGITFNIAAVTGLTARVGTNVLTNTGVPTNVGNTGLFHLVMWGPGSSAALFSGTDLAGLPASNQTLNLFATGGNPATGGAGVDGPIDVEVGYLRIPVQP